MKEVNYWQQFLQTGKVEDYLRYCRKDKEQEDSKEGDCFSAGASGRYGPDFENGTRRGI